MKLHRAVRLMAFALLLLAIPAALSSTSSAQIAVGISVRIGPPALPVYEQPLCPGAGYLWTPGYWAWSDDAGYYWVPGTWVVAPVGMLWTPGYWGWNNGFYAWNAGYWGPQIGFYGGINYGFGYGGVGFVGGEWRGGAFYYNTAVMRVNTTQIRNVYVNRTVIINNESRVAFNGGQGGIAARPTAQQEAYAREKHTPPVAAQLQQERAASHNRALFASVNHGAPAVAATAKAGKFSGAGVVRAKAAGAPYHAPAMSPREARASAPAGNHATRPASEPRAKATANEKARPAGEAKAKAPAHESKAPAREAKARRASEPKAKTPPHSAPKATEAKRSEPKPSPSAAKPAKESAARPAPKATEAERSEPKPSPSAAKPVKESAARPAPKAAETKQSSPKPSQSAAKPEKQSAPPKQSAPKEHKG
jgi:WXXGXW repeat (2 copies)